MVGGLTTLVSPLERPFGQKARCVVARKTVALEDVREIVNKIMTAEGANGSARETASHIWETVSMAADRYKGFMYVNPDGSAVSVERVQAGDYMESRRFYF